jgi:hypothetical protein
MTELEVLLWPATVQIFDSWSTSSDEKEDGGKNIGKIAAILAQIRVDAGRTLASALLVSS